MIDITLPRSTRIYFSLWSPCCVKIFDEIFNQPSPQKPSHPLSLQMMIFLCNISDLKTDLVNASLIYISNDRSSFQYSYGGVKKKIEYSHDFFCIASGFGLGDNVPESTTRGVGPCQRQPFRHPNMVLIFFNRENLKARKG